MSRAEVRKILHRINALDEADRLILERELARRLESDWKKEVAKARKRAIKRRIDEAAIDRAIERRRYGA